MLMLTEAAVLYYILRDRLFKHHQEPGNVPAPVCAQPGYCTKLLFRKPVRMLGGQGSGWWAKQAKYTPPTTTRGK